MHFLLVTLLSAFTFLPVKWSSDFTAAKDQASKEHKCILINFSGSDWCGPCIRLRTEFFESDSFKQYAENHLVLVNADFPRLKKNRLSKEQQAKNDMLAELYNSEGAFPLTVLVNAEGKVLKRWDGVPNSNAIDFTTSVKVVADAGN